MEMEQRGEQSISLSMSRVAEMTTSAVANRGKDGQIKRDERKERMDTSSLMEQILSKSKYDKEQSGQTKRFKISWIRILL